MSHVIVTFGRSVVIKGKQEWDRPHLTMYGRGASRITLHPGPNIVPKAVADSLMADKKWGPRVQRDIKLGLLTIKVPTQAQTNKAAADTMKRDSGTMSNALLPAIAASTDPVSLKGYADDESNPQEVRQAARKRLDFLLSDEKDGGDSLGEMPDLETEPEAGPAPKTEKELLEAIASSGDLDWLHTQASPEQKNSRVRGAARKRLDALGAGG
jgi:hypothetical protein